VEQRQGVGDARDEPAQAGEQQQFFDLPDHDGLPGEGPGHSNNEERELGFRAPLDSVKDRGNSTRLSRPRSLGGAVAWCCPEAIAAARALAALLSYASAVRTGRLRDLRGWDIKWPAIRAWGRYHSRILDQWAANTGCLEGATAEKAALPVSCPLIPNFLVALHRRPRDALFG
jgi:hypothetical protein